MGKLGVGIGDEFPIDDGKQAGSEPPRDADYEKRREEYRKARDAWREQRRQWRDAWREKRRAFREDMRARHGGDYDHHDFHDYHAFGPHHVARILAIAGTIILAIILFSHIYLLFGLIVLAGLYYAYRGGFDHFDFTAPPRSAPPASPSGTNPQ
jgi:hypothetical protein